MNEEILAREAKTRYMREWRRKNPEKVKANNQRYWAKKALTMMQQAETNNGENKEG